MPIKFSPIGIILITLSIGILFKLIFPENNIGNIILGFVAILLIIILKKMN